MSALKLKEFDIARHAFEFERAETFGKVCCLSFALAPRHTYTVCVGQAAQPRRGGLVGIKSRVGLALVYLNQHACGALAKEVSAERKRHSLCKALKELTAAVELAQQLVLLANFVGFSCADWTMVNNWVGTAYAHCQRVTQLMDARHKPDEQPILFRGQRSHSHNRGATAARSSCTRWPRPRRASCWSRCTTT